jgi:paraquat-inducible protein A
MGAPTREVLSCETCGLVHTAVDVPVGQRAVCTRCGQTLASPIPGSLQRTAAFSLAALILYIPANLFPILQMDIHGIVTRNRVWDGCVRLYHNGDVGIAIIVFLASILIPCLKLLGLFLLVATAAFRSRRWRWGRTWIFRFIDAVGRWAMLDVFVLAVVVSLVEVQRFGKIIPGDGAAAFAAVVVLTTLAGQSFDPRLIWQGPKEKA